MGGDGKLLVIYGESKLNILSSTVFPQPGRTANRTRILSFERKRKKEGKKEKERGGKNERARKKRKELILAVGRQWSLFSVGNQSSA